MPVILIALNYLRTQWLALVIMVVYLFAISALFALNQQRPEVLFFLRSQPLYILFLALMLALPAIQTDRKSRRIIALLSKGIHRWEYIGGILCGCSLATALLSMLIWATAYVLCLRGGYPASGLGMVSVALWTAGTAAAGAGLLYSTFLHPMLATLASTLTLFLPYLMRNTGFRAPGALFPVSGLVEFILGYRFGQTRGLVTIVVSSLLMTLVCWMAATAVFARRDVTISPE